jgi:hypothetical protein
VADNISDYINKLLKFFYPANPFSEIKTSPEHIENHKLIAIAIMMSHNTINSCFSFKLVLTVKLTKSRFGGDTNDSCLIELP